MRGYYHRSTEFPLDCWEPYSGMAMSDDARRVAMTTVLSDYYEFRDYIRANCHGVYAAFHRHLVNRRNDDCYSFRPISLFPDPSNEDWEEEEVVPTISCDGELHSTVRRSL